MLRWVFPNQLHSFMWLLVGTSVGELTDNMIHVYSGKTSYSSSKCVFLWWWWWVCNDVVQLIAIRSGSRCWCNYSCLYTFCATLPGSSAVVHGDRNTLVVFTFIFSSFEAENQGATVREWKGNQVNVKVLPQLLHLNITMETPACWVLMPSVILSQTINKIQQRKSVHFVLMLIYWCLVFQSFILSKLGKKGPTGATGLPGPQGHPGPTGNLVMLGLLGQKWSLHIHKLPCLDERAGRREARNIFNWLHCGLPSRATLGPVDLWASRATRYPTCLCGFSII